MISVSVDGPETCWWVPSTDGPGPSAVVRDRRGQCAYGFNTTVGAVTECMLNGKTVLVTGASRGMGRSVASRLSREGAAVALLARTEDQLGAVAATLRGESLVVAADVRDESAVSAGVETVLDEFGRIDAVVNNAGVSLTSLSGERKHLVDVTTDEWDVVVETNLKGVFLVTRSVLPSMLERGAGNVLNVSSGLGRRAAPMWEPYLTTKWGLEGFTRSLALEVHPSGVNVNAVDPGGGVDTGFAEHLSAAERAERRSPDVMDDAVVHLVGQDPGGVTGYSMTAGEWEGVFAGMLDPHQ